MSGRNGTWIVGCDTGGTFTDVFALSAEGEARVAKVPSTPPHFDIGVVEGVEALGLQPADVGTLFHGTTVTTNAVITKTGAPTALVTTQGFRDVLEIRRANREELYDILWDPPPPLVPRRHRLEVVERVDYSGAVVTTLDEGSVRDVARKIRARNLASVGVCLINAHMNPEHERRVREILLEELPDLDLSLSTDILPEPPEFERTATTVANAYCAPVLRRYMDALEERLEEGGFGRDVVLVMHNGGGTMTTDYAKGGRGQDAELGSGCRGDRRRRGRGVGRAPGRGLPRHGRDERRHRRRPRWPAAADDVVRPRVGHADPVPVDRRDLHRRRGRIDRVARPGRIPPQRPAVGRRRPWAGLLRPRWNGADEHRRAPGARPGLERPLPRGPDAARRRSRA